MKIRNIKKHNSVLVENNKKYLQMGFTKDHAEALSLFEMYIPGFRTPKIKQKKND